MMNTPGGRRLIAAGVALAILVLSVGVFVYVRYVRAAQSAAELLPTDSGLLVSFVATSKDKNIQSFKDRYDAFGGKHLLGTSVTKSIRDAFSLTDLNYTDDIEPWVGSEIVFAKTSSDADAKLVVLAQVRDIGAATDRLATLEANIKGVSRQAETGSYHGVPYSHVTLTGKTEVFVMYVRGYVVAAFAQQDVERVIDVAKHRTAPLASRAEYKKIRAQAKEPAAVFAYAKLASDAAPIGGGLIPSAEGLRVQLIALPSAADASAQAQQVGFVPHAFALAPVDASFVVELPTAEAFARGFFALNQQIKGGTQSFDEYFRQVDADAKLSVKDALFGLGGGHITVSLLPRVSQKALDVGAVFEASDGKTADYVQTLEKFLLQHAKKGTQFQETIYKGHAVRYLTLDTLDTDLNYAVIDGKVLVANSQQAIRTLIETVTGDRANLGTNDYAKANFDKLALKKGEVSSFFFADSDALLNSIFSAAVDDQNQVLAGNGSSQIVRLLLQLVTHVLVASAPTKAGDLFSGYLLMK